jgi:hypothetical protein
MTVEERVASLEGRTTGLILWLVLLSVLVAANFVLWLWLVAKIVERGTGA